MTPYRALIDTTARAHGLDPNLVEAVVLQESSAIPWAWNPEPHYRYLWNVRTQRPFRSLTFAERAMEVPPSDFPCLAGDRDQEWWAQQASWGLMQIMGAVAREHGFGGDYLAQLCDPDVNIPIGCSLLASLLAWSGGDVRKALAGYNGGRGGFDALAPQRYASKVLKLYDSVKAAHQ
jgi:soluble lytic murein transglycosylase-like protein